MLTHLDEKTMILLYYNEPIVTAAQRAHLFECPECAREMESLRATLRIADHYPVPEPPPRFERDVWARLSPALEPRRAFWRLPRIWVPALAMALLLIGAFFLGRISQSAHPSQPPIMAGLTAKARERILVISLADHLERAGMLLTDLSNDGAIDRERAKDLVSEGRVMQQALERTAPSAKIPVFDDVERVLLEVANAPDRVKPAALQEIRERIGSESLLFKVRVVETNLRSKGQTL